MIECLIIGDSIGSGIATIRPDCAAYTQPGINSRDWNRRWGDRDLTARVLVIALGSNDLADIKTRDELLYIRRVGDASDRVLWILPSIKPRVREIILSIADTYGDDVIEPLALDADGIHPTGRGYRALGKKF